MTNINTACKPRWTKKYYGITIENEAGVQKYAVKHTMCMTINEILKLAETLAGMMGERYYVVRAVKGGTETGCVDNTGRWA